MYRQPRIDHLARVTAPNRPSSVPGTSLFSPLRHLHFLVAPKRTLSRATRLDLSQLACLPEPLLYGPHARREIGTGLKAQFSPGFSPVIGSLQAEPPNNRAGKRGGLPAIRLTPVIVRASTPASQEGTEQIVLLPAISAWYPKNSEQLTTVGPLSMYASPTAPRFAAARMPSTTSSTKTGWMGS